MSHDRLIRGRPPVSYTHLDVYKRQGMTLRDNLGLWATGAGYRLKWEASNYIQVVTPRTYNAEFLDVVKMCIRDR